jgi:hypothetical protein
MIHSDKIRRFEYSTTVTPVAKQIQRTKLQRDIDDYFANGGTVHVIPSPEPQPKIRKAVEPKAPTKPASTKKRRLWTDPEIDMVRELKAQGFSHSQVARAIHERFGREIGRGAIESLCHLRGIPSVFIKKPPREKKPIDEAYNEHRRKVKRVLAMDIGAKNA